MLLAGNDCVTDDEATMQFVVWSIVAAPLIMGNVASCVLRFAWVTSATIDASPRRTYAKCQPR